MKQLIILLLLMPVAARSQSPGTSRLTWTSSIAAGAAVGQQNTQPLFQLGTGAKYKWLYAGLGVGYDSYRYASIPIYAELKAEVPDSKGLFAYSQVGYSLDRSKGELDFWTNRRPITRGGLHLDIGFGYRLWQRKRNALALSVGYGFKKVKSISRGSSFCGFPDCSLSPSTIKKNYNLNRVVAKLAFDLGW